MPHGGRREGAGRKLGVPNKLTAEMRARAMALGLEALERIGELAIKAESESAQVSAANLLLNRGFGRPAQAETEPHITVNVERVYRWARNEKEATFDPARQRPQIPNASDDQNRKTIADEQVNCEALTPRLSDAAKM